MSKLPSWDLQLVPKALKRPLWLLVPLGIALTAVGLFAPFPQGETGWWDKTGFIVNLASGLTAACFGIPVAFYGIQWLLEKRQRENELKTLEYLLRKNVLDLGRAGTGIVLSLLVGKLSEAHAAVVKVAMLLSALQAYDQGAVWKHDKSLGQSKAHLEELLDSVQHDHLDGFIGLEALSMLGRPDNHRIAISKLNTIMTDLLPRFDYLEQASGISEYDLHLLDEYLHKPNAVEILKAYAEPPLSGRVELVLPSSSSGTGFSINTEALAVLQDDTSSVVSALWYYNQFLQVLGRVCSALEVDIEPMLEFRSIYRPNYDEELGP
ncbi:hypothetical protein GCM10023201_50420 [Actinomycetospora corticicola]|uniref:Uncharacterized protein n=1 Tax=Actinomycetospora corticicola TaxID=663602 RepID=A0A7Y9DY73_9PSEU|nr:hypothetical protein [Actinomycetospora corticicola]NYD37692.1 hypothetical protein [Actinomycetospora corticicola]